MEITMNIYFNWKPDRKVVTPLLVYNGSTWVSNNNPYRYYVCEEFIDEHWTVSTESKIRLIISKDKMDESICVYVLRKGYYQLTEKGMERDLYPYMSDVLENCRGKYWVQVEIVE